MVLSRSSHNNRPTDSDDRKTSIFCSLFSFLPLLPVFLTEHIKSMLDMTVITPITSFFPHVTNISLLFYMGCLFSAADVFFSSNISSFLTVMYIYDNIIEKSKKKIAMKMYTECFMTKNLTAATQLAF